MSDPAFWTSLAASIAVALAGGLVTLLAAQRSIFVATVLAPLVAVAAVAAGFAVGIEQMLFDEDRAGTMTAVILATVPVALLVGVLLAVQIRQWERRRTHEIEHQRRVVAAEQARREVMSWMSHDLRTPLGGIRAMAESLLDDMAPDRDEYLRRIVREADRTSDMVDDLLALTRLTGAERDHTGEQVDVADVASDALASLRPLAEESGVTLTGRTSGLAIIVGDTGLIARAITNLVVNAVTASAHHAAKGVVTVDVAADASAVRVSVSDTCGGIPDESRPHLFEAGWRGESARTPETRPGGAGAGLGLAIVTAVAHSHAGSVDVANRPGDGCTFTLCLPLR